MNTRVQIFTQDFDKNIGSEPRRFSFEPTFGLHRKLAAHYDTKEEFEPAAEEAFRLTNQPERVGPLADYRGPSLSVGDVVVLFHYRTCTTDVFLCDRFGWKRVEPDHSDALALAVEHNDLYALDAYDQNHTPEAQAKALFDAVAVIVLSPEIRKFLTVKDPKALDQCFRAYNLSRRSFGA